MNAVFRCMVRKGTVDTFVWSRTNGPVPDNAVVEGNVLSFTPLLGREGGRYRCRGEDSLGRFVVTFAMLTVRPPRMLKSDFY